jgi:hypothetical protein
MFPLRCAWAAKDTTRSRATVLPIKGHAGSGPHCDVCSSFFRRTN